ncbi:ferritin-like domain-containing protein [Hymenobacter cavernae]|uniref:Ferritin-like domain-containing protein n=1 Tax=Hymenobacter cavernae TaxID=2044852 RepID=A0ABQ1TIY7_9BACT|nr:ferritin-like domain-containing protein [Hymenobacter cavernae]GGE96570.1 hypothetical protein GCM10011383_04190 [Hymenobacter cavernae]
MDLFKIISDIEKVDPEVYERFDTRRRVFKHMSGLGKKVTAATLPGLLSAMFQKAYGQTSGLNADIVATLNLALQLEYLERNFYQTALATTSLNLGSDAAAIAIIRDDEIGHIAALKQVLGTQAFNGGNDVPAAAFDYTAGGKLPNPFASTANFYATAQSFVDTGMRAYKGGAPKLMSNKDILQAALNIHSVEARHSSHVRMVRRGGLTAAGSTTDQSKPKSWISGNENGGPVPAVTAPVYNAGNPATDFPAESNIMQAGVNVQTNTTPPMNQTITTAAATEAFDEPLDADTVKAIGRMFRSNTTLGQSLFA